EVARLSRRRQGRIQAAEIGQRDAPTITIAAEMTLLSAEVILGDHRESHVGDESLTVELGEQNFARLCFGRIQRPRGHEFAIRQMRETFAPTLDTDELLDVTPPRRHILVAD